MMSDNGEYFVRDLITLSFMDHDVFYTAMLTRDSRFDGTFFIGVKTTGIYCRPICPAKPRRENVEFFPNALAAEKAGYRPCLRCRPECAPLSPAWSGTSAVVQRALKLIAADSGTALDENGFAEQFGVTARHLRRLFVDEVGQTPKQIILNNRLNFARKLVVETALPMTAVSDAAGFSSLRRFNDAFKKRFHRPPSVLRKGREEKTADNTIRLSLSYRPPMDWHSALSYYRNHPVFGLETTTDTRYERVFELDGTIGALRVSCDEPRSQLHLDVTLENPAHLFAVARKVRRMFDLDSDPLLIADSFQTHSLLDLLWTKYPGLRVARGWDPFETAVCTILGQLVSIHQAGNLIRQLVQSYGRKISHPADGSEVFLFPTPATLAAAPLTEVKTTEARRRSIRELSRLVSEGKLDLHTPQDAETMHRSLLAIPGIGPWSAEYIRLRALGETDAFPATDLILRRALEMHQDLRMEKLRPWRSYGAVYLWKHYAASLSKQKKAMK